MLVTVKFMIALRTVVRKLIFEDFSKNFSLEEISMGLGANLDLIAPLFHITM